MDRTHDSRVRAAAFAWLADQVDRLGTDVLLSSLLCEGFQLDGQRALLQDPWEPLSELRGRYRTPHRHLLESTPAGAASDKLLDAGSAFIPAEAQADALNAPTVPPSRPDRAADGDGLPCSLSGALGEVQW